MGDLMCVLRSSVTAVLCHCTLSLFSSAEKKRFKAVLAINPGAGGRKQSFLMSISHDEQAVAGEA